MTTQQPHAPAPAPTSAPTSSKPQAPRPPVPAEFPDLTAWAAWLYFVDEMTQSEVAQAVGVSRVTVIKLLNEAKAQGLVRVQIAPRLAARVGVSRRLCARFGLASALVIPQGPGRALVERLGEAGAAALVDSLAPGDVIGVSWGRTVLAAARSLAPEQPVADLTVVQVSPSSTGLSADFSPELCVALTASNLGARSVSLMAPAVVSSAELRAMLLQEPAIQRQMEVIGAANRVILGVGQLGPGATMQASALHSRAEIDQMVAAGAVGAVLGRFLDAEGRELPGPSQDRMMGLTLEELRAIPQRIGIAGGPDKTAAIAAALRGGYITDLVTDQGTAERLLAEQGDAA